MTSTEARDEEIAHVLVKPLEYLAALPGIGPDLKQAARRALGRIDTGCWKPRLALEHGDLWLGNVLLPPAQWRGTLLRRVRRPFVLVDWYGARLRAPGMYDLVRFARSLRMKPHRLRRHVVRHCSASGLACELPDAAGALAASLGFVAMHLGQFPMAKFISMAESCYRSLLEAMDAT